MEENRVNLAVARTVLPRLARRYRHNTRYATEPSVPCTLWLHKTPIVQVHASGLIQLDTGGHETATTRRRMNEALSALGATFHIYQEAFTWKVWRASNDGPPSMDYLDYQLYEMDGTAVPWPA